MTELLDQESQLTLSEDASLEILKSSEAQKVITLQDEILFKIKNAVSKGISLKQIESAALRAVTSRKDEEEFLKLVFGSASEGYVFLKQLKLSREEYLNKNPIFLKNTTQISCKECQNTSVQEVKAFFKNINAYHKRTFQMIYENSISPYRMELQDIPPCGSYWQQAKLLACVSLCSASTAGAGLVLCGWACWCMLCPEDSSLAEAIC